MARQDLIPALATGLMSGLIAAWAMEEAQGALAKLLDEDSSGGESSTTKAADRAAIAATGKPVPKPMREDAGRWVHYATGALLGGLYGVAASRWGLITAGFGTAFGAATALVLDDAVVPALKLGPPVTDTPPRTLAYGMASHLVFGVVLEACRRELAGDPDQG